MGLYLNCRWAPFLCILATVSSKGFWWNVCLRITVICAICVLQAIKESAQPDVRHEISRLVKPMTQVLKTFPSLPSTKEHCLNLSSKALQITVEVFSLRDGSKENWSFVFSQALDAAFSHDLEQQQKSAKAGNKPNGFWGDRSDLTNIWIERAATPSIQEELL